MRSAVFVSFCLSFLWSIFRFHHCWLFRLQCSVTCGSGIKIRSVECSDKDFSCNEITKPQATMRCNLKECPEWKTSPWEEVSEHLHRFSEEHFAWIKFIRSFFFFHKTGCIRHGWSLKYTGRVSWLAHTLRLTKQLLNKLLLSSKNHLFPNKAKCKNESHLHENKKIILMSMTLLLASLWNRGLRQLGSSLLVTLKLLVRLHRCCVEMHYGTVLEVEFVPATRAAL